MDSFGQAMETIKESIAVQSTKLDNMPVGGGGAELKEVTAERDQLFKDYKELLGNARLEDSPSLDDLLSQDDLHRARRKPRFRPRSSRSLITLTYASLWRSDFTVQEHTDRYVKRWKGP
jgi:hypothetical protein